MLSVEVERKQLSSVCGLAPVAYDSGKIKGHRYVTGGRKEIKSKLYFCAVNLIKFDPRFKNKLDSFIKKGKNKKLALIALARKEIIILNAAVKNELKRLKKEETKIRTE
jgi:transposase